METLSVLIVYGLSDSLISVDLLSEEGFRCKFTSGVVCLLDAGDDESVIGYG